MMGYFRIFVCFFIHVFGSTDLLDSTVRYMPKYHHYKDYLLETLCFGNATFECEVKLY